LYEGCCQIDYGNILTRAFQITKNHRSLWLYGVILAITSGGGSNYFQYISNFSDLNKGKNTSQSLSLLKNNSFMVKSGSLALFSSKDSATSILLIIGLVVLLAVVVTLVFLLLQYISQAALIGMVEEIEGSGKTSIKAGFSIGWKKWWRLLAITLIVSIPAFLISLLIALILATPSIFAFVYQKTVLGWILAVPAAIIWILLIIAVVVLLGIVITYASRYAVINGLKVIDSVKSGYFLLRQKIGPSLFLWLISIALGMAYGIASTVVFFVLAIILFPIFLLLYSINQWLVLAGLPLAIIAIFGLIFISGLFQAYFSTYWTLSFKELTA